MKKIGLIVQRYGRQINGGAEVLARMVAEKLALKYDITVLTSRAVDYHFWEPELPEGGDEIQTMKAGLMEIADIFVVNKCDRSGADTFVKYLRNMLAPAFSSKQQEVPVLKTAASKNEGIEALYDAIKLNNGLQNSLQNKVRLYAQKVFLLITKIRMKDIDIDDLQKDITVKMEEEKFNLYSYLKNFKQG